MTTHVSEWTGLRLSDPRDSGDYRSLASDLPLSVSQS